MTQELAWLWQSPLEVILLDVLPCVIRLRGLETSERITAAVDRVHWYQNVRHGLPQLTALNA
jgi:hypothetical protein